MLSEIIGFAIFKTRTLLFISFWTLREQNIYIYIYIYFFFLIILGRATVSET